MATNVNYIWSDIYNNSILFILLQLPCGHQCSLICHHGDCTASCEKRVTLRCPCKRLKRVSHSPMDWSVQTHMYNVNSVVVFSELRIFHILLTVFERCVTGTLNQLFRM